MIFVLCEPPPGTQRGGTVDRERYRYGHPDVDEAQAVGDAGSQLHLGRKRVAVEDDVRRVRHPIPPGHEDMVPPRIEALTGSSFQREVGHDRVFS